MVRITRSFKQKKYKKDSVYEYNEMNRLRYKVVGGNRDEIETYSLQMKLLV